MEGGGGGGDGNEEDPPRDPRLSTHQSSMAMDVEGHRHHNVYMGLPVNTHRHRSRHHRHRHHHKHTGHKGNDDENRPGKILIPDSIKSFVNKLYPLTIIERISISRFYQSYIQSLRLLLITWI